MINFTTPNAYRKIEYYLYNYDFIDAKVNILKDQVLDSEYNQNYARWIKNKSSSLEDLVIKNMDIERRILKLKKWKGLIDNIVKEYAEKNQEFYNFIHLKYFIKLEPSEIEEKLDLSLKEQKDMQARISQVLGHTSSNALDFYLSADFEHLEQCSLRLERFKNIKGVM